MRQDLIPLPPSPEREGGKKAYLSVFLTPLPWERGWDEAQKKPPSQAAFIKIFTALAPL
jgi:hypothetical protein